MKKEKTVITIETRQRVMIHRRRRKIIAWCAACAAETQMLSPEEAARLRGISTRAVYRQIENDGLHFTETESGLLLVCCNSLMK